MKLNLGCGNIRKEGWVNCDFVKTSATDKVFSMTKFPYPFEKDSVDEIELSEVLEHLPDTVKVMGELHRILKPNGKLHITVPYYTSYHAWSNPEHLKAFNYQTFKYFRTGSWEQKFHNFGFGFQEVNIRYRYGRGMNIFSAVAEKIANAIPELIDKTQLKGLLNPEGLDVRIIK